MHKFIRRSWEIFEYTGNMVFTIKVITILGLIPIASRIFFKEQLEAFSRKLSKKRGKDVLFTTPFGKFIAKTPNGWSVITKDYEPSVRKVMLENYKKNKDKEKTFINIGCHIGRWLVEFVGVYGYKGIAFEPSKETFKYLKVNTILSNIEDKTQLFNFGLSNNSGTKKFKYIPWHDGHSHITTENESKEATTTIETKVFDELDLGINLETVKLIMIDVEGHEYEVLQGMKETLKKLKDVDMIIEIFEDDPNKDNVISLMKSLGFDSKKINHADYLFYKK